MLWLLYFYYLFVFFPLRFLFKYAFFSPPHFLSCFPSTVSRLFCIFIFSVLPFFLASPPPTVFSSGLCATINNATKLRFVRPHFKVCISIDVRDVSPTYKQSRNGMMLLMVRNNKDSSSLHDHYPLALCVITGLSIYYHFKNYICSLLTAHLLNNHYLYKQGNVRIPTYGHMTLADEEQRSDDDMFYGTVLFPFCSYDQILTLHATHT